MAKYQIDNNWAAATLSEKDVKEFKNSLSDQSLDTIATVTYLKWRNSIIKTLIFTIISIAAILALVLVYLTKPVNESNEDLFEKLIICFIVYAIPACLNVKSLRLFSGASTFKKSIGFSTLDYVFYFLGRIVCLPWWYVSSIVSLLISIFFSNHRNNKRFQTNVNGGYRVMLPLGVCSTFDELISDENYYEFSNTYNRMMNNIGQGTAQEAVRFGKEQLLKFRDSKNELLQMLIDSDVSHEEYKRGLEIQKKQLDEFEKEFGDLYKQKYGKAFDKNEFLP